MELVIVEDNSSIIDAITSALFFLVDKVHQAFTVEVINIQKKWLEYVNEEVHEELRAL